MNQINVNPGREPAEVYDTGGDRTAAAGINLITVLIVLGVLAVIAWYLFTGPLHGLSTGGSTNVNVNPAPTTTTNININPPSPPNPAPGNNTGTGGGTGAGNTGGNNNNPPPANP